MKSNFKIPSSHPVFDGHFPQYPVVPGAMLLQEIEHAVQKHWPHLEVSSIQHMKFIRPVRPDERITITLEDKKMGCLPVTLSVRLHAVDKLVAKGGIVVQNASS
jgi:3-hydroxyacyl-[acyl-carrier-protein] dehydratase